MDKTEFIQLEEFEIEGDTDPDDILDQEQNRSKNTKTESVSDAVTDDLLDSLGI
jgi:myo-inositol-1-phosphate synthase